MSFCPDRDIHSVYLDNELPENFKNEYELHIKNCPKCQKELEVLRGVRSLLQQDSVEITPDEHYLDQSFERLQVKMTYSKNTRNTERNVLSFKSIVSVAAAAAVFAIVIPVRLNNKVTAVPSEVLTSTAVASNRTTALPSTIAGNVTTANNVSFDSGRSVRVSGNIQETVLPSDLNRRNQTPLTKNVKEVEVFRPELEDGTISIRITIPGVSESPVTTEINVPMGMLTGIF